MRNWIFFNLLFLGMRLDAQSHWAMGANLGVNNTEVRYRSAYPSTFANHATTLRWGIWGRYFFKEHWAVRAELNREQRGWKAPTTIWDANLMPSTSWVDYRYYFWTMPVSVEYFWGQSARFYTSVGLAPMYQTAGTKYIRAIGEELSTFLHSPSSLNKTFQGSGFVNMGYNYPIGAKWNLYGETRYGLSFSYYEAKKKGYHYAYSLNLGAAYHF